MTTKPQEAYRPYEVVPELVDDFRNFLFIVWKHLRLPSPTENQYEIAEWLQDGPRRRGVQAFRGIGKSWITAAYVLWRLYRDPQLRIMVLSANQDRAAAFTRFCLALINDIEVLAPLRPENNKANPLMSALQFNVGPALADQAPSVRSASISGMITGGRADLMILDDVEIPDNCATEGKREKLARAVSECGGAILKPNGEVIVLGTPQCEQSLYVKLEARGYVFRVWPARYPSEDQEKAYGNRLAPRLLKDIYDRPELRDKPTEPSRFDEPELLERELEYGRTGFALQFMLDTRLSDTLRYPLRISDLIVLAADPEVAPEKLVWSQDPDSEYKTLPNVAMDGDRFYKPARTVGDYVKYQEKILVIDPSGRGRDECVWMCLGYLNGYIYIVAMGASTDGYGDDTLQAISRMAKDCGVSRVVVEENYGDGMFSKLLQPVLHKTHACTVEEVKVHGMKEARIIDTLEPVMNQHRLVVCPKIIEQDHSSVSKYDSSRAYQYQLIYQLTRMTKEKGALGQDDRVDCLAIGVGYFVGKMNRDADKLMEKRQEKLLDEELKRFLTKGLCISPRRSSKDHRRRVLGPGRRRRF